MADKLTIRFDLYQEKKGSNRYKAVDEDAAITDLYLKKGNRLDNPAPPTIEITITQG